jgi:hypothetical protein
LPSIWGEADAHRNPLRVQTTAKINWPKKTADFPRWRVSGFRHRKNQLRSRALVSNPTERCCGRFMGLVSLGQIPSAPRTRNAIPPHVADENPKRKTENQNSIDQPISYVLARRLAPVPLASRGRPARVHALVSLGLAGSLLRRASPDRPARVRLPLLASYTLTPPASKNSVRDPGLQNSVD